MESIYTGRAWVFGDNINTDIISPPQYMELSIEEAARYCMSAVRPDFAAGVRPGDILVAGNNLGSGSSRETSPLTLRHLGIRVVIARSFARIFYRNCINVGLLALRCLQADRIKDGETLKVLPQKGRILCQESGRGYTCDPLPANLCELAEDGGLLPHLLKKRARGAADRSGH